MAWFTEAEITTAATAKPLYLSVMLYTRTVMTVHWPKAYTSATDTVDSR